MYPKKIPKQTRMHRKVGFVSDISNLPVAWKQNTKKYVGMQLWVGGIVGRTSIYIKAAGHCSRQLIYMGENNTIYFTEKHAFDSWMWSLLGTDLQSSLDIIVDQGVEMYY